MRTLLVLLTCFAMLGLQGAKNPVVGGPENVLVVQNGNSAVSKGIAAYYMAKRDIAKKFLVTVYTQDSSASGANESISPDDYIEKIHKPIRDYLIDKDLTDTIQYIVLTKGIPIRLTIDPTGAKSGAQSVDSILATMDLVNPIQIKLNDGKGNNNGNPVINRYWRCKEPFSHAKFGGYLVTRLDGYTESDAKALVDHALAPAPKQAFILLDADKGHGVGDISAQPRSFFKPDGTPAPCNVQYNDFNADLIHLYDIISKRPGLDVQLDKTEEFVSNAKPLSIYVSWGSNDPKYHAETYHSLKFAPRSLVETAVSSSGRTFLPTSGGQSLIADLIAQGAAGAKGYVTEPYLASMASPSVFVDLYTSGRNLAESYYAASRFIGWKDIVIGDPLCKLHD